MAYVYPSPRTGTAQDLMRVITRAGEERIACDRTVLPVKGEVRRRFLEPVARGLGIMIALGMELIAADWAVALHDRLFRFLAAGRSYPFDETAPKVCAARNLAARLEQASGRKPALLAAISHPPVMGDLSHLNFELVRHATRVLRAVRGRACRPRLVAAIDPFALDTATILEEGLYAGFMGTYHLGLDRLALGRGHLGPLMSPQARWDRMPLRLFRLLTEGGEVGMVLSGGVPATGRILYAAREWARRVLARSPMRSRPAEVLAGLNGNDAFARFKRESAKILYLPQSPWRLLDAWLMTAAAGFLPGETVASAANAALSCLAVPAAERPGLKAQLERDFARETPSRRRLFRLLAGRVVRHRPLVFIPVVHHTSPLGIEERGAWGVSWQGPGRVRVVRADAPDCPQEMTTDELAEHFTETNFA